MIKLNALIFAFLAIFSSFIAAAGAEEAKHCAPRPCCGCPGNGKAKVKVLMDQFNADLQDQVNSRDDAFALVKADGGVMFVYNGSTCIIDPNDLSGFYNVYFPAGSLFMNVDKEFLVNHDGTIDAKFLCVVTQPNETVKAYDMTYKWSQDAQCNWHITAISGIDLACQIPTK